MDAVNYRNGPKNQWRRTAWNAIERATASPKDALVLYLPGSTDLDRSEATRRGFKPANLVAIERDETVAKSLRNKGVTTIIGTLNSVIQGWSPTTPIHVVVADFQCGITREVERFATLLAVHPALQSACVLVNLQRGRDAGFDERTLGEMSKHQSMFTGASVCDKNRAARFYEMLIGAMFDETSAVLTERQRRTADLQASLAIAQASGNVRQVKAAINDLRGYIDFRKRAISAHMLPTYRSAPGAPLMDGAVIAWEGSEAIRKRNWHWAQCLDERIAIGPSRCIRAALAIRTRRLRGELARGVAR
jgi:hypothetical protein